jgi:hypothetical protein
MKAYIVQVTQITQGSGKDCFLHPAAEGGHYIVKEGIIGAAIWKGEDSVKGFLKHTDRFQLVAVDINIDPGCRKEA